MKLTSSMLRKIIREEFEQYKIISESGMPRDPRAGEQEYKNIIRDYPGLKRFVSLDQYLQAWASEGDSLRSMLQAISQSVLARDNSPAASVKLPRRRRDEDSY